MNADHDPLLDACLDEVLGGQKPPDLTARILDSLHHASPKTSSHTIPSLPTSSDAGETTAPSPAVDGELPARWTDAGPQRTAQGKTAQGKNSPDPTPVAAGRRALGERALGERGLRVWKFAGMGFAAAVALSVVAMLVVPGRREPGEPAVGKTPAWDDRPGPGTRDPVESLAKKSPPAEGDDLHKGVPREGALPPEPRTQPSPAVVRSGAESDQLAAPRADRGESQNAPPNNSLVQRAPSSSDRPLPLDDEEVIGRLNTLLRENWKRHNVEPARPITASQWCERAYRVVLGREPTQAEWKEFQTASRSQQRQALAASLLSDRYAEEFARHWSAYFTGIFLDPDLMADGSSANRDGMLQYFRRALLERKPWDEVALRLITATGSGVPGEPDYDGAANFLLARADKDFALATADTCRLFLGRTIACQQCHDGPHFDSGKQKEFWELNAFFRQLQVKSDPKSRIARLANVDLSGPSTDPESGSVLYERSNGILGFAYPVFVDGTSIPTDKDVTRVHRRELLGRFVTQSPDFRRTICNRTWAAIMGRGFVPFEQVVRNNTVDHPRPLVELGDQFAAHHFDIRKVIFWTLMSEPFELGSEASSLPLAGSDQQIPLFDRYEGTPARTPSKVYDNLAAIAKQFGQGGRSVPAAAKFDPLRQPLDKKNGSSPLTLDSSSGSLLVASGGPDEPMFKAIMANHRLSSEQKAEHLFQMAVHRQPRPRETALIKQLFEKAGENPQPALQALWNALHAQGESAEP